MPAKSAAKKSAKKSTAKVHKGKSLGAVKPLKDGPGESFGMNYGNIKVDYKP